jgi:hypothetical protein
MHLLATAHDVGIEPATDTTAVIAAGSPYLSR